MTPLILGDAIEGEAREVGRAWPASRGRSALRGQPARPPCVLLSGGETTVTVRGGGRGGRNVEFLLSLAVELDGLPGVFALAGDTDGVDGAEEIAGAIITPDTLARAAAHGVNAKERLADNDGHGFFEALGDSGRDRPDADQRQRLPRHPDHAEPEAAAGKPPDEHASAPERQDRRHPGTGQLQPETIRRAVRGGRGRVPPELQPRHA